MLINNNDRVLFVLIFSNGKKGKKDDTYKLFKVFRLVSCIRVWKEENLRKRMKSPECFDSFLKESKNICIRFNNRFRFWCWSSINKWTWIIAWTFTSPFHIPISVWISSKTWWSWIRCKSFTPHTIIGKRILVTIRIDYRSNEHCIVFQEICNFSIFTKFSNKPKNKTKLIQCKSLRHVTFMMLANLKSWTVKTNY